MQMHGSHQRTVGALGKTETKNFRITQDRITQSPNLLYLVSTLTITLANDCTLATSCEELTHWKRLWCSGSWWWTGRPRVLWFIGSERVGHYWATELNWCSCFLSSFGFVFVGLFLLRCFPPREIALIFVVKLFWWWWSPSAFACL